MKKYLLLLTVIFLFCAKGYGQMSAIMCPCSSPDDTLGMVALREISRNKPLGYPVKSSDIRLLMVEAGSTGEYHSVASVPVKRYWQAVANFLTPGKDENYILLIEAPDKAYAKKVFDRELAIAKLKGKRVGYSIWEIKKKDILR